MQIEQGKTQRFAGAVGGWKAVVAITRGGLVPAAIIARELGIRNIETVCIASYHEYKDQGSLVVLKGISEDMIKDSGGEGEGVRLRIEGEDGQHQREPGENGEPPFTGDNEVRAFSFSLLNSISHRFELY